MRERTCILVVGVGRSGTSAVAGTLARSRLDGHQIQMMDFIEADDGNPRGYYEDRDIVELNKGIFRELDTWVLDVFPIPVTWYSSAENFAAQLQQIIAKYDGAAFALKDPRISLLLPFYLARMEHMGISVYVLHVHRNPHMIVNSLYRRNGIRKRDALRIITKYHHAIAYAQLNDMTNALWLDCPFESLIALPDKGLRMVPGWEPDIEEVVEFLA